MHPWVRIRLDPTNKIYKPARGWCHFGCSKESEFVKVSLETSILYIKETKYPWALWEQGRLILWHTVYHEIYQEQNQKRFKVVFRTTTSETRCRRSISEANFLSLVSILCTCFWAYPLQLREFISVQTIMEHLIGAQSLRRSVKS